MARTLPATYTNPTLANLTRGEIILASDFDTVVQAQNYHYARAGNRVGGILFDPPWQTTSLSYTITNSNATTPNRDMDTWAGVFLVLRPNSSGNAQIRISAYGADYDIQYTITRLDTGAAVTTSSFTKDETFAWESTDVNVAFSTYSAIPLQIDFEARFANNDALCQIFQIDVSSTIYSAAASLPTA